MNRSCVRAVFLICVCLMPLQVLGNELSLPNPGHEGLNVIEVGKTGDITLRLWAQYRIMYNNSNIPGPGGTTAASTKHYDFFRQRFRLGFDLRTSEDSGGYAQLEYRGGWGGSSPAFTDPRASWPVNNAFNRLSERGLRYGYIYQQFNDLPGDEFVIVSAGILPLTDQVGRLLFDADWDFNVGGITAGGTFRSADYRLGYVRLVEGVGGSRDQLNKDGSFFIADYNFSLSDSIQTGFHIYNLTVPESLGVTFAQSETWYGLTAQGSWQALKLNALALVNNGKIGNDSHNGTAFKLETGLPMGRVNLSLQALTASGDELGKVNNRFVTVHQLIGTAGFWGYTHIFTANGPSDVNDIGLEIGNGGAGLTTLQAKIDFPLIGPLSSQLFGGWFRSDEKRNNSRDMGSEFGGMITCSVTKNLSLECGAARAIINDFYGQDADNLDEIFSRFQLTW